MGTMADVAFCNKQGTIGAPALSRVSIPTPIILCTHEAAGGSLQRSPGESPRARSGVTGHHG